MYLCQCECSLEKHEPLSVLVFVFSFRYWCLLIYNLQSLSCFTVAHNQPVQRRKLSRGIVQNWWPRHFLMQSFAAISSVKTACGQSSASHLLVSTVKPNGIRYSFCSRSLCCVCVCVCVCVLVCMCTLVICNIKNMVSVSTRYKLTPGQKPLTSQLITESHIQL